MTYPGTIIGYKVPECPFALFGSLTEVLWLFRVAPAHCTGFEAIVAFSKEMPNEFVMNTAGTQYTFAA